MQKKQRFKTRKTQHRRRREGRTNYVQRLSLLKSGQPRLVIRRSANNIVCQVIKHDTKGDKTLFTVSAKDLKKAGWKAHCGSIPAAYLIGLICGAEAKGKKVHEAVLDMGLHTSTKGSRIYAAVKGVVDGGLKVPHSEEILPDKARISGKHIADYATKLKSGKPQVYKKQFSLYIKNKITPEDIVKHFEEIKKKILK
jgi:large subunit ribosomal protein L18